MSNLDSNIYFHHCVGYAADKAKSNGFASVLFSLFGTTFRVLPSGKWEKI